MISVLHRDNIARAVALSYLFLGGYYLQDIVVISTQTIACASVAAFILVGADAVRTWLQKHFKGNNALLVIHGLTEFLNTLAIMILLVVPFADFDFTKSQYEDIGTASSLAGLGISVYLLAKKNEKASDQKNEERNAEIHRMIEECKNINRETKELINSYNKDMKELIRSFTAPEETIDRKD